MQLNHGVSLPTMAAPCPPAYGRGQQALPGTLLPRQPKGLGPSVAVQQEPLYPTGSCPLRVPAHTGPLTPGQQAGSSGQQAGGSKRRAPEDTNVPASVLHRPRSPGDAGGQSAPRPLPAHPPDPPLSKRARSMDPRDMPPQDKLPHTELPAKTAQGLRTPRTDLKAHLLSSIQSFHPLGRRVKVVGPVRQPLHPEPQAGPSVPRRVPSSLRAALRPSAVPAASKCPTEGKKDATPAVTSSSEERTRATTKPQQPSRLPPSATGGQTPRERLPQQRHTPPHPPADSLLPLRPRWVLRAQPTPLEEQEASVPITAQQRPQRERMKKLAQEERERAALQTSLGQLQFFVQRETDMRIADEYGYL